MVIFFRTKKLQKLCCEYKWAVRKLGSEVARTLQRRITQLDAFECLADVPHSPPFRMHELKGERKGQISIDLVHPVRLLLIPANDPIPLRDDGGYDLRRITEIEIVGVEDTH